MIHFFIHYSLHLLAPGLIAKIALNDQWKKAWIIMILTMLVDLDHLLSTPIYDATRCSIGFHPFHSYIAIGIYAILFFVPKMRIISIGLLFHMFTDLIDFYLLSRLNTF